MPLFEVEEQEADAGAEVVAVGPDEEQQARLDDRHLQVVRADLLETGLGREA